MLGSAPSKKRNPIMGILIPLFTILLLAGGCFALCEVLFLLNNAGVPK